MPPLPRGRNLKSTMGRRSLLTPEMANQIVATLQLGMPIIDACEGVGISEDSYENWMKKGERLSHRETQKLTKEERMFTGFFGDCKAARAKGKISLRATANRIALDDRHPEQAGMVKWLLERCYPKEYGRRSIRLEFDEPLTLDTPGGSVPHATCNIIVEGGPVPDAGPIIDEPEEMP